MFNYFFYPRESVANTTEILRNFMFNREGDVFGKGPLPDLLSSTWLVYFSELRLPLSLFTNLACFLTPSYPATSTQYQRFLAFQGTHRYLSLSLISSSPWSSYIIDLYTQKIKCKVLPMKVEHFKVVFKEKKKCL